MLFKEPAVAKEEASVRFTSVHVGAAVGTSPLVLVLRQYCSFHKIDRFREVHYQNCQNKVRMTDPLADLSTASAKERREDELLLNRLTTACCLAASNTMVDCMPDPCRRANRNGRFPTVRASGLS